MNHSYNTLNNSDIEQKLLESGISNPTLLSQTKKKLIYNNIIKKEKKEQQEKTSAIANQRWKKYSITGESEYLRNKQLSTVEEIKFGKNKKGNFIVIPIIDNFDKIWGLQLIYDKIPEGKKTNKSFLYGTNKAGNYARFGSLKSNVIYICEGVATGLSIYQAKPDSMVIVAFDCYNLARVTRNIVMKYSNSEVIIAADNDLTKEMNIGIEKAEIVAREFNLKLTYPKFEDISTKPSDFNDLHKLLGINAVKTQLDNAEYTDLEPIIFALNNSEVEIDVEAILGKNALTNFVIEVSKSIETPVEFGLISALCCVAACLQHKFYVKVTDNYLEPLVLQAIILGRSGDGKSPVFNNMIRPLLDWEREEVAKHKKRIIEIETLNKVLDAKISQLLKPKTSKKTENILDVDQIKKEVLKLQNKKIDLPDSPRIIAQDTTSEQAVTSLKKQGGKLAIFEQEGGVLSTIAGRYSNGIPNTDVFVKGYSGSELIVDRFDKEIALKSIYVSICIFVQPEIFANVKNLHHFLEVGFLGRCLFANPKSKVGDRKFEDLAINQIIHAEYVNLIKALAEIHPPEDKERYEIKLSEGARKVLKDFRLEIEFKRKPKEEYGENAIGSWVEKSKGNTIRIAGILTLIDDCNARIISEETMLKSISLMKILTKHATSVFNYVGNDSKITDAIKLWEYIRSSEQHLKFSYSCLRQSKKNDSRLKHKENFDRALSELEGRNLIIRVGKKIIENDKRFPGRPPSGEYRINSKLKNI